MASRIQIPSAPHGGKRGVSTQGELDEHRARLDRFLFYPRAWFRQVSPEYLPDFLAHGVTHPFASGIQETCAINLHLDVTKEVVEPSSPDVRMVGTVTAGAAEAALANLGPVGLREFMSHFCEPPL